MGPQKLVKRTSSASLLLLLSDIEYCLLFSSPSAQNRAMVKTNKVARTMTRFLLDLPRWSLDIAKRTGCVEELSHQFLGGDLGAKSGGKSIDHLENHARRKYGELLPDFPLPYLDPIFEKLINKSQK